jgi:hypothetical protein
VVTISASYGGATQTAALTVLPAILSSLTMNPPSVIGGPAGSSTGTVTLNGPAPSGGATAMLSVSDGSAWLDDHVTIPAGATSATFTVFTQTVTSTRNVTVFATYAGTTKSANLEVRSPVPGL